MSDEIIVKIAVENKKVIKLVSVCAWCPKEKYPKLSKDEEYTHGLCTKHYQLLTTRSK